MPGCFHNQKEGLQARRSRCTAPYCPPGAQDGRSGRARRRQRCQPCGGHTAPPGPAPQGHAGGSCAERKAVKTGGRGPRCPAAGTCVSMPSTGSKEGPGSPPIQSVQDTVQNHSAPQDWGNLSSRGKDNQQTPTEKRWMLESPNRL